VLSFSFFLLLFFLLLHCFAFGESQASLLFFGIFFSLLLAVSAEDVVQVGEAGCVIAVKDLMMVVVELRGSPEGNKVGRMEREVIARVSVHGIDLARENPDVNGAQMRSKEKRS